MCRSCLLLVLVLVVLDFGAVSAVQPGPIGQVPIREPAPGLFLLASRDLVDPNFYRSVILLLRHDPDGTLGLIVNRRTRTRLAEVAPHIRGAAGTPYRLHLGGPVALNWVLVLLREDRAPGFGQHVVDDIYFTGEREALEQLLAQSRPETELHLYAGHAGWAPGQLAAELARGDWYLVRSEPSRVFSTDVGELWEELIERYEPHGILARQAPDAPATPWSDSDSTHSVSPMRALHVTASSLP